LFTCENWVTFSKESFLQIIVFQVWKAHLFQIGLFSKVENTRISQKKIICVRSRRI
jgi:hypothetical protein